MRHHASKEPEKALFLSARDFFSIDKLPTLVRPTHPETSKECLEQSLLPEASVMQLFALRVQRSHSMKDQHQLMDINR
jgi:hypothetical protein